MSKKQYLIPKNISVHVLMIGVYWHNHAPGGISSVVNEYADNFEIFKYVTTAASRDDNKLKKMYYALSGLLIFVFNLVFDWQIKIVHVQGSHGASFHRKSLFVKIAKRLGKKVVWHMHASQFVPFYESQRDKKKIVKTLNLADKLIVLSRYYYDFYKSIGVDEGKIVILNNIVPKAEKKKVNYNDGKVHFLFLGEISHRKGAFDMIQAISNDYKKFAGKVEVRIGGNGETERIMAAIKDNGLEGTVKFEGWVNGQKKTDLLNWADVYILPSYNEGLPISILEALSYGCPIISTPVGGIEEVVKHGKNGLIVEPGNLLQIADAMKSYINSAGRIQNEGAYSQEIVKPFLPEPVFFKLKEIYLSLI